VSFAAERGQSRDGVAGGAISGRARREGDGGRPDPWPITAVTVHPSEHRTQRGPKGSGFSLLLSMPGSTLAPTAETHSSGITTAERGMVSTLAVADIDGASKRLGAVKQ
jgi:hypothetical protein